jgi:Bacterial Ig domain
MSDVGALIVQNLITGNKAPLGGGIFTGETESVIVNNTIADNDSFSVGSFREVSGIFISGTQGPQLINNIIVAKPGQVGLRCHTIGVLNARFNNIFSAGGPAYAGACPDMTGTNGNISADPLFIAPTQGDYHLPQISPSIDAGDNQAPNIPDKDLDGDPRILDGDTNGTATIDMGVDEFRLPLGSTTPISIIRFPGQGATVFTGTTISITGLARDAGGGIVARVEVSVDGGVTWNLATGTTAWSYNWTPTTPGPTLISSRAVDDSGNVQDPTAEITVTVRTPVTIRVPSEHLTIQAAIDVAEIGDTVMVAPGTYSENINFRGKAITVRSESGRPEDTTIDGGNADSVVVFNSGERRDSVLNGFTLQNGRARIDNQGAIDGGGVKIENSSPTITNNEIKNNHACRGGGIGISSGSPLIQRNKITNNDINLCSEGGGGGISIRGASSVEIL